MNNFLSHFYHKFAGYGLPGTFGGTTEERAVRGPGNWLPPNEEMM